MGTDKRSSSRTPQAGTGDRLALMDHHTLNAVMDHEGLRIAVIDGQWLRAGDVLDGCTLRFVNGTDVRFDCANGEAVLTFNSRAKISPD